MLYPIATRKRAQFELGGIWNLAREVLDHDYRTGFIAEKKVAVPSSYNDLFVEEEFRMWMKGVWYSREFYFPEPLRNERVVLRLGSVNYRAEVYLNGHLLGGHETGYTPFEFDITDVIDHQNKNLLCVRVENLLSAQTIPMGNLQNRPESGQFAGQYPDTPFDFFPYAGIHRPVVVYTTSSEAWLEDIRVTTEVDGNQAIVLMSGTVSGTAKAAQVTVTETGGSARFSISAGVFSGEIRIPDVKLWDVGQPNLYHARIELLGNGGIVYDEYEQRFGVRTVKVEGNRFLLNGKPVYLQGFGRHEDFHIIGKGLNHSINIRDHELIKWINANSYRTTHYPYSEELIRLADEQGILIISEAPAVSINFDFVGEKTLDVHLQALRELIERDFNNPSVIMWSVGNEATTDREEAKPYFKALANLARAMDHTRPITMITCKDVKDQVMEYFDVVSANIYPGWYYLPGQILKAKDDLRRLLDGMYEKFGKPVFITEFGADTIAGMHSLPAEQWSEEYQTELILGLIEVMRNCDFVIGEHLWNFADFRTAQNFVRVGGNKKGIFTRERQPKMVAHFLKQLWKEPRYTGKER